MNEHQEGLNFDDAVEALQGWVGRTVRVEVGAIGSLSDVMALIDLRIGSVNVFSSSDAPTKSLHVSLENESGEYQAGLALAENEFEQAYFFPDQEFLAFAGGSRVIVQLVEPSEIPPGREEPRWTPNQRAAAVRYLEALPWGDIEAAKFDFELALFRALDATADVANTWKSRADREGHVDEFSLTAAEVSVMSDELRLAYVATLLRSGMTAYGATAHGYEGIAELVHDVLLVDADLAI